MLVKVGTYTGNGSDNRSITGVGFQPDFVMIVNAGAAEGATRYRTQQKDNSFALRDYDPGGTNWPATGNYIQGMEIDGFQIGTAGGVNTNTTVYYYLAIKDNGSTDVKQGTYTGNGGDNRDITGVGFQPDFVLTKGEWEWSGAGTVRTADIVGDTSLKLQGDGLTGTDKIQSLLADGFQIGANEYVNQNTYIYHYLALKEVAGVMAVGTYAGNSTDNRNITGVGFQPDGVIIFNDNSSQLTIARFKDEVGDNAVALTQDEAEAANKIQSFGADGFQVGTHADANATGTNYYYIAFKNTATPTELEFSQALSFNGTDQRIHSTTRSGVSDDFTITGWAKVAGYPAGRGAFLDNGENDGNGYEYGINSSGNLIADLSFVAGLNSGYKLNTGQWYHCVVRRSSNVWQLFVNGVKQGNTISNNPNGPGGRYSIGAGIQSDGSGNDFFNGALADMRFYERALTDAEILALSNRGNIYPVPSDISSANLRFWHELDGDTTSSSPADSNTLTAVNSPTYVDGIMATGEVVPPPASTGYVHPQVGLNSLKGLNRI